MFTDFPLRGGAVASRGVSFESAEASRRRSALLSGYLVGVILALFTFVIAAFLSRAESYAWVLVPLVTLPLAALFIAVAIIREKNRLYKSLEEGLRALKLANADLNDTRHYLQMILDNSRVLIITTDVEGRIVEFNREAQNLLGYPKEEVAGKDVLMLYADPLVRSELMNRGRPIDGEVWEVRNREVVLKSKTGRLRYISMTLSTMVNDRGRIIGTVGIGKDISEQKMLQFKLLQSERLAGIGTLASGIAHEINNPLAGILGMAEAIMDEGDPEVIRSHTADIIKYTAHARSIVRELSTYSRAATDGSSIVDLSEAADNALKMARHSISMGDISVESALEHGSIITANPGEMQQVFVNLIINAVQAMPEGGTLRLECRSVGPFVTASVSDTGCGIEDEHLRQVFDPFFTTKPAGVGTGLGLYVVYKLVTRHNGSIHIETRRGEGSSFLIKFPAAA